MIRFLLGVLVGILICLVFLYFGGGATVKKIGEGLADTGEKMEAVEELMKKETDETFKGIKKKILKEGKTGSKDTSK
jgi:hypothetical protein